MNAPEQRSDDWRAARAGKLTASCFGDIIAVRRDGKPTAARQKLMYQLAFERLSGIPRHEVGSKSMAWGTDLEAHAREAYEIESGNIVTESSFLLHPVHDFIGASPDGLCPDRGLEMKCPHEESVHVQTWIEGMPEDHVPQVQGNMLVTGLPRWDFVSYDPRQAEPWRLYIQTIERDEAYIKTLLTALLQFEAELRAMVDTLRRKAA